MSRSVKYQRACAVALVVLAAFGSAACGDEGGESEPPYVEPTVPTETESPTEEGTAAAAASLATGTDDELGEFLTDNDGLTLYLFTADTDGTSTCYDQCAELWPPLLTDTEDVAAAGAVDASLIGTVERNDGTMQVTYREQPLYYYADDADPGDTEGQGLNAAWYVVAPDGSAITTTD